ncbi:MAG: hypothetical protein GYA55_08345 [SAR324 cluster bacterium]|uniref:Uncharacterized protein n=1 Tax=SAR324 cluster bacterium TaxID=2024889 RepID=A0A7X9ILN0_9DELT|nr:hypothetical protein [SAR324 cluster bacterium]
MKDFRSASIANLIEIRGLFTAVEAEHIKEFPELLQLSIGFKGLGLKDLKQLVDG